MIHIFNEEKAAVMGKQFDLDYSLDLCDGVKFSFGLVSYTKPWIGSSNPDAPNFGPDEAESFEFHYLIMIDAQSSIDDLNEINEVMSDYNDEHLQGLMKASYKANNQPEPSRRSSLPWNMQ